MKMAEFDASGFQNIVLMLIGVLMMMLVSNVLTIISNPENIKIGALVTGSVYGENDEKDTFIPPKFQNMRQDPIYVDVEPTRLIIYPEKKVIEDRDLMFEGNEFEQFLDDVERVKSVRYVVLLLRPGSATFQRKLRQVIRDRGVDVGFEPWDAGRDIIVAGSGDSTAGAGGAQEAAQELPKSSYPAQPPTMEIPAASDAGGAAGGVAAPAAAATAAGEGGK